MAAAWGRAHVEALWNSHLHQPDADRPFAFDKRTQDQQAIPAGQRLEQRLSLVRVFLDLLYFHIFERSDNSRWRHYVVTAISVRSLRLFRT